ncbi:hypothetical protein [Pseudomonas protegens]|uniref:hypothetical protein n=1 Tax=Pseudomonas protegens TaxID=380021 RepID=UPI00064364F6|nr:hypothetical protein [Pseudomonas protegens]
MTSYSTTETITEDDLITVSRVFPPASRPQLLILRNLLNDRKAAYRTYENGMVAFDIDALVREVSFKGGMKTGLRVSELVSLGVNLQALASAHLSIPMAGKTPITIRL